MDHHLIREKAAQASSLVPGTGADCWITYVRESSLNGDPILPYIVGCDLTWHSAFLFGADGSRVAIVGRYDRQMVVDTGAYDRVEVYDTGVRAPLLAELRRLAPRRVALNFSVDSEICDGLTHGMYLDLVDIFRMAECAGEIVGAEPIIAALRQRKTGVEIARMKEAIRHTLEIFALTSGQIRPGATEAGIASFVQAEVERRGLGFAWDRGTCPSVFTGPDTAGAHYGPTGRQVQPGHVVNMDFGVRVDGYVSDIQRSWYVLREGETSPPQAVQHGFATIRASIEAARNEIRPGAQGVNADAAARAVLATAGFAEFPHGLGHQVGRMAHDGLALLGPPWEKYGKKPFVPLEEGMVFTIEPRLTVPGHGVVTIEEMVVVTASGAEYLSDPQTELHVLPGW
ncbi:MAG: aminopeptidase P family protein [Ignavibacteriae bacterium]|nr:aminopeptidase P family protein [Ignavibacteriota bacterium]